MRNSSSKGETVHCADGVCKLANKNRNRKRGKKRRITYKRKRTRQLDLEDGDYKIYISRARNNECMRLNTVALLSVRKNKRKPKKAKY